MDINGSRGGQSWSMYPLYLRLLARLDRQMPLIIEHLALADVQRARDYVLGQMENA